MSMRKAILGAASALALASPAAAADLPVFPIAKPQAIRGKLNRTSTEPRHLSLSRSRLPPSSLARLSL
jgi:opacity protein-like surface antigen